MPRLDRLRRFAACAALLVTVSAVGPAMAEGDVTIGFAAASTGWPWYVSFIKRFNEKAAANSWKTTVLSANADVPTQLNQIHDLVAKKVNYLVVDPLMEPPSFLASRRRTKRAFPLLSLAIQSQRKAKTT